MISLPQELQKLKPVFKIESFFPHRKRIVVKEILAGVTFLFFGLALFAFSSSAPLSLSIHRNLFFGLFLIFFTIFIKLALYEAFFYSSYMQAKLEEQFSFELAHILIQSEGNKTDAVNAFLQTKYGKAIMQRLEVSFQACIDFMSMRQGIILRTEQFEMSPSHDISDYASWLYENDTAFADFLFSKQIQKPQLIGASRWIEEEYFQAIENERWWSKEKLDRVQGLGKNWSYGETYELDRYARDITEKDFTSGEASLVLMDREVDELNILLSRGREANAVVVSDDEGERISLVEALAERIQSGKIEPMLEHKRVYLLRGQSILQANPTKIEFETEWQNILMQTLRSGNTILVIEDFASFLQGLQALGSNFSTVFAPFLHSSNIQLICFVNNQEYHSNFENNQSMLAHFETLRLQPKDTGYLFNLLRDQAITIEKKQGVFFTYQALEEIITDASRYFSGVQAAEKIIDLLIELVPQAYSKGKAEITRADVLELIEGKIGIPVYAAKNDKEKEKLLNLEALLHERIVGQENAVGAISQAMRRARSGLGNASKPLGTFLFLGPTGVGKTETAKALSDTFFGNNSPMIRLDMSEYAGDDGLAKLIGSYSNNAGSIGGNLVNALREHQYGVLLLDEFEKANEQVQNIFLQILDEGNFSDARGEKINARNLIIIATSNAGSTAIFDLIKNGSKIEDKKDEIIESIIHDRIFKPELINRFDGVIIFQPLDQKNLERIARLKLESFKKELMNKGYDLEITDQLISYLVERGFDLKFGARPMNRAIADELEEAIATSILKNELKPGAHFQVIQAKQGGHLAIKM